MIRKGSSGDGARWVQWQLRKHGGDLAVDGSFGAESQRTLRAFQQAYGLTADGVCGPTTRARLQDGTGGKDPAAPFSSPPPARSACRRALPAATG